MIVSRRHRFIFVKTRKTAGSSIQTALASQCGTWDLVIGAQSGVAPRHVQYITTFVEWKVRAMAAGYPLRPLRKLRAGHAPLAQILAVMGPSTHSYLTCAFVRNPFDLVISRFAWDRSVRRHTYDDVTPWLIEHYGQQRRWEIDLLHRYTHINGACGVEFVGRFESLRRDFDRLCHRLGFGKLDLPRRKSGFRDGRHYSAFYTPETRRLVETLFADDLRLFGYAFDGHMGG